MPLAPLIGLAIVLVIGVGLELWVAWCFSNDPRSFVAWVTRRAPSDRPRYTPTTTDQESQPRS